MKTVTKDSTIGAISSRISLPDESAEWDHIMEFRQNDDGRRTFAALRRWISKSSKEEWSGNELAEELDYLLNEYRHYMKIHKLKFGSSVFESVVSTPITVADSLVKGNVFKAISSSLKGMFNVSRNDIAIAEAELKASGREIAYIVNANDRFEKKCDK